MSKRANAIAWGLCVFLMTAVPARAENLSRLPAGGNLLRQAVVHVPTPGMVEAVLPPELHQAPAVGDGAADNQLDLCLLGPDGKPRACELFWREQGRPETISLEKTKAVLMEDGMLLWDVIVPADFIVNKLLVAVADHAFVGRVDVLAMKDAEWFFLEKNLALYQNQRVKQADIPVPEDAYKRFRLSFMGVDKKYEETPLLVQGVQAVGRRSGRDYQMVSFQPAFESAASDRTIEIRMTLPGSGLWIEDVKITTEALFQGTWQMGRETTALGRRDFTALKTGTVTHVGGQERALTVPVGQWWPEPILTVKMTSADFFGTPQAVTVQARSPRLVFLADAAGRYTVQAGCGNRKPVFEQAPVRNRAIDHEAAFAEIKRSPAEAQVNPAERYTVAGGPFHQKGYAWTAEVRIEAPGFYRVTLNERACLDENIAGLRLVKDGYQIPYFFGPLEERRSRLEPVAEYDADQNRGVYTVRLPFASPHWSALQISARGMFERRLVFENHLPGRAGWQPWKTGRWVNKGEQPAAFRLVLSDFPEDQDEIRLIIDHGDDQPLVIDEMAAVYGARDLFCLVSEPGTYRLFGGNPRAPEGAYKDFEMIKGDLMAAVPKAVMMGPVEALRPAGAEGPAGQELGGPFDGDGYTWSSPLTAITQPGFYRLRLNREASLENNRRGLRLVRNDRQVPFFMGELQHRPVALDAEKEYEREKNETTWKVRLPQPSVHWRLIRLRAAGIFTRDVVVELPKPGKTGWQPWRREKWTNRQTGEATLEIPMESFPADQTEIRLVMRHGDNQPLELDGIEAVYATQDVFFIAGEGDGYELVGGHPDAPPPSYDLALIRDHLLKSEPIEINLEEPAALKPAGWGKKLERAFSEQRWGLYGVLGVVTLILLIVIVRLFPKAKSDDDNSL